MDRADYEGLKNNRRVTQIRQAESGLRIMAQAEVPADKLVGTAEWDWFMRILKAKEEAAVSHLEALNDQSNRDMDLSPGRLAYLQAARIGLTQRIETYREVLDLPSVIKKDAESARVMLKELNSA